MSSNRRMTSTCNREWPGPIMVIDALTAVATFTSKERKHSASRRAGPLVPRFNYRRPRKRASAASRSPHVLISVAEAGGLPRPRRMTPCAGDSERLAAGWNGTSSRIDLRMFHPAAMKSAVTTAAWMVEARVGIACAISGARYRLVIWSNSAPLAGRVKVWRNRARKSCASST